MFAGTALFLAALFDPIRILISFAFSFPFLNLNKTVSKLMFVLFATATLGLGFAAYNIDKEFMYDKSQFGEIDKSYSPPFDDLVGSEYDAYVDKFIGSRGPKETAYIKKLVSQHIKDCEILMGAVGCNETAFKIKRTITSLLASLCHVLFFMFLYNYFASNKNERIRNQRQSH